MKRVLIINRGVNSDNIGDEAINYTLHKLLEVQNCKVDSANYTKLFESKDRKFVSYIKHLNEILKISRKNYDYVFIGGGQLILGNSLFPYSLFIWILMLKTFSNSKLVLFSVGVSSTFKGRRKYLISWSLKRFYKIFVRDQASKANLEKKFHLFSKVVPDVVCPISLFYSSRKHQFKTNYILFGLTEFGSIAKYKYINVTKRQYFLRQQKVINKLNVSSEKIKLIYNTKKDYECTLEFKEYLHFKHNIDLEILHYDNIFDYIDILASSSLVISSRMHALIIASSYGVAIEPVIRNEKLEVFEKEYVPFRDPKDYLEQLNTQLVDILL